VELITGLGLSVSSGLNAYIPMLVVGLVARFTDVLVLPGSWQWLENPWVLAVLGVLLAIEVVADKVPLVDHVNDVLQTVVRPTSGGIVVGAASSGDTVVTDPERFLADGQWVPVVAGAAVALAVHLGKAALRGVANSMTAGVAAPVLSTAEDVTAVALSVTALLVPIVTAILLGLVAWWAIRLVRRRRTVATDATEAGQV
jgi:hypothetical protein